MPTMLRLREQRLQRRPLPSKPGTRKLSLTLNKISAIGLDLKPAIGEDNLGLAWVAVQPGDPMRSRRSTTRARLHARPVDEPRHQRQGQPAATRSSA